MLDKINIDLENSSHIGGFIKTEIIAPLGLSVTGAAEALGITREAVSMLLNERTRLSPEMGIRIEKAFGVPMDALMRMQTGYDISQARAREGEIDVKPYVAPAMPLPQQPDLL